VMMMSLLVIDGSSLREVLAVPHQARSLDFEEAIYATLRVELDEEHGVLQLSDGRWPCEKAVAKGASYESAEYRKVVDKLCNARGFYELKGQTFVRRGAPPRLRWPAAPAPAPTNGSSM
jgi:hypothetical protein